MVRSLVSSRPFSSLMTDQAPLYDKFVLFGDSITEFGECHGGGFGFAAALRDGTSCSDCVLE